ncbi:MAG: 3'(2'),5'-bisphosphate nucleotidase CysQ [Candidatus Dadabacteria bacterium]|nr:MAG: 3'(2'),5'-bisphosphate nucleotidase CysQ [Candidatus Dadabacteria bacterium]
MSCRHPRTTPEGNNVDASAHPYAVEHDLIEPALRALGPRLLELPQQVQEKEGDLGPLTELDLYVDRTLSALLLEHFPDDGWISEESPRRTRDGRYWIVDPVDGTREVVAGIPEWAVSVGLWENGEARYGWLFNAQRDLVWHGGPGIGAWRDDTPIQVTRPASPDQARVAVSRTDTKKGLIPSVEPEPIAVGSIAYKLGLVAAGEIDATVSVTPKNIWDIAGGIPIVLGAGGAVIEYRSGASMAALDIDPPLQEGGLVAAHPDLVEQIRERYLLPE